MLEISSAEEGQTLVVTLSGRVDAPASKQLEEQAQHWVEAGQHRLVLDCSAINYISSAGLRVFLLIAKKIAAAQGSLKLCGLNGAVREVFDISGFSKLFTIVPTRADAL
ncbi:MAG: STAS domain-containing protein [Methylotetracoccus sp.]